MLKNPSILLLKQLAINHHRIRYPNTPEHARTTHNYTDKTANGLTRCIIDYLRFNGHQAERINTTGTYRMNKTKYTDVIGRQRTIQEGFWTPSGVTKGSADISATINGRSVKIEIKIGRDRLSPEQKHYRQTIERAGGTYLIASSFQQFLDQYHQLF
ncbi:MAG: hypothetical protein U1C46_11600 [Bacteroidales bacterium]|nr:hypothetical protein [Bacteroidales bacterium]